MHMLTNLIISLGVCVADVWPTTGVIPTLQPAPLDLVGGRKEGEMKDIFEVYTTRHIRKIARKSFII